MRSAWCPAVCVHFGTCVPQSRGMSLVLCTGRKQSAPSLSSVTRAWQAALLFRHLVVSNSLWPTLCACESTSLLCPWDSPGKNTGYLNIYYFEYDMPAIWSEKTFILFGVLWASWIGGLVLTLFWGEILSHCCFKYFFSFSLSCPLIIPLCIRSTLGTSPTALGYSILC